MKRAYPRDIEVCGFLEHSLHLRAIFAHNADVIPASFVIPGFFGIERAELAKAIGRKQRLCMALVSHEHFGPMHHRGTDKIQLMHAKRKLVAFGDNHAALRIIRPEKGFHHRKSFRRRDNSGFRICFQKYRDIRRVIGFHVLHNEIIRLAAAQSLAEIIQPLMRKIAIDRIHDRDFLIQNDIRIVRHAIRHAILPFKQVYPMVIHANILYVFRKIHVSLPIVKKRGYKPQMRDIAKNQRTVHRI